jgi:V8-like Glu-specific endopeptidase
MKWRGEEVQEGLGMKRKSMMFGVVGALALTAGVLGVPGASAHAPGTGGTAPVVVTPHDDTLDVARYGSEAAAIKAYWTPARMRAAVPLDADPGTPATDGSPASGASAAVPHSSQDFLHDARSVGKLFLHMTNGDFTCSAVTIAGGNRKNLISTAAHCVDNPDGTVESAQYVPGYSVQSDGSRNYGSYPLNEYVAARGYNPHDRNDHDVAFIALRKDCCSGIDRNAGDISEMNLVSFRDSPNQRVTLVGYGAANGDTQHQYAKTDIQGFSDPTNGTRVAANVEFGGGASGGPFFAQSRPGHWDKVIGNIHGLNHRRQEVGALYGENEKAAYDLLVSDNE